MKALSSFYHIRGVAERQTRGAQNAVGIARAGSTPAAPTMKEGPMEINECRPEIAASVASGIRTVAAWLDRHADDLAADTGVMVVAGGSVSFNVTIQPGGPYAVSTGREYYVPRGGR